MKSRPRNPQEHTGAIRGARFALASGEFVVISFPLTPDTLPSGLTAAEIEITKEVLTGATTREIASRRATSSRTISNQLGTIYAKLGVNSRAELVALFRDGGYDGSGGSE